MNDNESDEVSTDDAVVARPEASTDRLPVPGTSTKELASESSPSAGSAGVALESLAPQYDESQHATYLHRLNAAMNDPTVFNIALTGRYGSGKSSVLDQFERGDFKTRRLAISTLSPDTEDVARQDKKSTTTTNRIQKELVKQLIYSAEPATLRHSRFSRIAEPPRKPIALESGGAVAAVLVALALVGWLPAGVGAAHDPAWLWRLLAWIVVGLILSCLLTAFRLQLHNRFFVSDVSAAGTALKLSPRTPTFFDEYLEEIVNYFDKEDVDVLILEDLDRFEDPHIFEALRELNTLLNHTPQRKNRPLRFVYAVRDSLFQKLNESDDDRPADRATAETARANRTKFFDLVIPIVPFISHRNAQDLLADLLRDAGVTGIDRALIDLVAQHATDMRLLRNIRNEYLVFAERLLEQGRRAPGLEPNGLFALVAYKNFHLEDFEEVARRGSNLDAIYDLRRDLVRTNVARLQEQRRKLMNDRTQAEAMSKRGAALESRLHAVVAPTLRRSNYPTWKHLSYRVAATPYSTPDARTPEFWEAVANEREIEVLHASDAESGAHDLCTISSSEIDILFPEATKAGQWRDIDANRTARAIATIDSNINLLRGSEFDALAARPELTLPSATPAEGVSQESSSDDVDADTSAGRTFAEVIDESLDSDLAKSLVRRGFIDRNFALYAAQFYGSFTGVDVATFVVQSVQPNVMEVDYQFTSDGAVDNLIAEAGEDFLHSAAALNLMVVDHLLATKDERVTLVVANIIRSAAVGSDTQAFLRSYLSSNDQRREELVERLSSQGWVDVLTYLMGDNVPDADRVALVDSALRGVRADVEYTLSDATIDFLSEHYTSLKTLKGSQPRETTLGLVELLHRAHVLAPRLMPLAKDLRSHLVRLNLYELTADNLRTATEVQDGVSLDVIRDHDVVYDRCMREPASYIDAITNDKATSHTIENVGTLATVLTDIADRYTDRWDDDNIDALLTGSAVDSTIGDLRKVPESTWPFLAAHQRMEPTFANVEAYRTEGDGIDESLATLLTASRTIVVDEDAENEDREALALALVNASSLIESAELRVNLVWSLEVSQLPVDQVDPQPGQLLALLLKRKLVPDDATSFTRFQPRGWAAVGPAVAVSKDFGSFMTAALLSGMVPELLNDPSAAELFGTKVVEGVDSYVAADDKAGMRAAASYAVAHDLAFPAQHLVGIASATDVDLTMRVLASPAQDYTPEDVVQVLAGLGTPYDYLTTRAETQFEVPDDEVHRTVFRNLENAGKCKAEVMRRKEPVLRVELV